MIENIRETKVSNKQRYVHAGECESSQYNHIAGMEITFFRVWIVSQSASAAD